MTLSAVYVFAHLAAGGEHRDPGRARRSVPVGERSSSPGETIVAWRTSPPTRGGADEDDIRTGARAPGRRVRDLDLGFTCGRIRSPSSASARASSGTIENPSAAASTNAQNAPP